MRIYKHQGTPTVMARIIQLFMGLFGMKKSMERRIGSNTYPKMPAHLPGSLVRNCNVGIENLNGRKVWTFSPLQGDADTVILFLHGGAYYANLSALHWGVVGQLMKATQSIVVVPDYPLAPEACCSDTYRFLDIVYQELVRVHANKKIIFMGDSAGGGLAVGFALKVRNEGAQQPQQLILFSPWLDVTMTNPEIVRYDAVDKVLNITALIQAGKMYAGELDVTDYRVSPLYGDVAELPPVAVFIGTNELLFPDVLKFYHALQGDNNACFQFPGMFHDWVLISSLPESREVVKIVAGLVKGENVTFNSFIINYLTN
jgi:acetyl esterase/lipase